MDTGPGMPTMAVGSGGDARPEPERGLRMEGKKKAAAATVSEAAAQAVLRRGPARDLAPDEEKLMRMRLGASLTTGHGLERVGRGFTEAEVELLSYEIEAFLNLRERWSHPVRPAVAPAPSRAKEKIVRALRKKN